MAVDIPVTEVHARILRKLDRSTTSTESEITEERPNRALFCVSRPHSELFRFHRARALFWERVRFASAPTVAQYFFDTWTIVFRKPLTGQGS